VDEAAAERALERSLTRSGALLLPAGVAEIQLAAAYARSEASAPTLLVLGSQSGVGSIEHRGNDYSASVSGRVGLPFDAQLELRLPYRMSRRSWVAPLSFTRSVEVERDLSGSADWTIGLAKTLHRERGALPDVIGRVSWNTGSGSAELGAGLRRIRGGLTVLKRQDPLVFVGDLFYEATVQERNRIRPGDEYGVSFAVQLAASPAASLSVGLDQVFSRPTRIDGRELAGSDPIYSMLTLGTTCTLNPRFLLSLGAGIGLTRGAPSYTVDLSVTGRFDFPQ
jgi:hypothetical protein